MNPRSQPPAAPRRIGSPAALNTVPLTWRIEDQVRFGPPSRLAQWLRRGEIDAALVSVTELLRNQDYVALDGVGVASRGAVRSVVLAHRAPLEALRVVHCDPASLTSVNLTRVLLAERGLRPEFRKLLRYEDAAELDAVLLIGDRALDFARSGHPHTVWDLGAAWFAQTGLPFVFAMWTMPANRLDPTLCRLLRDTRDRGVSELEAIIATRPEYDLALRSEYFRHNLAYTVADDEKSGIERFRSLMNRHGLGPAYPPRFVAA